MDEPGRVAIYPPIRETPYEERRTKQLDQYRQMREGLETQLQDKQREVVEKQREEREQMRVLYSRIHDEATEKKKRELEEKRAAAKANKEIWVADIRAKQREASIDKDIKKYDA